MSKELISLLALILIESPFVIIALCLLLRIIRERDLNKINRLKAEIKKLKSENK